MSELQLKDPVRPINRNYLQGLEVISARTYPLPGARCKGGDRDPRFKHLMSGTGEAILFEHLSTVRHKDSSMFFVAFRQTMDALYLEQNDPEKYPQWLMDSGVKKTELSTYIHSIKPPFSTNPSYVMKDAVINTVTTQTRVDRWLQEIKEVWLFDTVAFFLLKNNIISQEMYGKMR